MGNLGKIIPLSKEEVELYVQYDINFFVQKTFTQVEVSEGNRKQFEEAYSSTKAKLRRDIARNKKQTLLAVDGAVRKMHSGGFLPSLFELDETREMSIMRFDSYGESKAYFEVWRKYRRRKIFFEKFWNNVIKIGALLGFVLTAIKLIEVFKS